MKPKFKVGDRVFTNFNLTWGQEPMQVTQVHVNTVFNRIIYSCRHDVIGLGGFNEENLMLYSQDRHYLLKEMRNQPAYSAKRKKLYNYLFPNNKW